MWDDAVEIDIWISTKGICQDYQYGKAKSIPVVTPNAERLDSSLSGRLWYPTAKEN